jgi:hypothetical protein
MEVLAPTLTTSFPVMVPDTMTTLAVFPETADLSADKLVTVTGLAEPPPVVLFFFFQVPVISTKSPV